MGMRIKDLEFEKFIGKSTVQRKVKALAEQINDDYRDRSPVFLPILNGAFMFASDLMKTVSLPCKVSFVKVSSYAGMASTGQLKTLVGLDESLFNQDVIIIEDIVDTGLTLQKIVVELKVSEQNQLKSFHYFAKMRHVKKIAVKYVGFEIANEFVLGYGLDYDGYGRNLTDIYQMKA